MARVKRMERVVALTKQLVDHPYQLFSFTYFCKKFEVAKSTLSEDVLAVRAGLEAYDLGRVETWLALPEECVLFHVIPKKLMRNF